MTVVCCRGLKRKRPKTSCVIVEGPEDVMGCKKKSAKDDLSSESEGEDCDWDYEVIESPPGRQKNRQWWSYVGRSFMDEGIKFLILAVCKCSSSSKYVFRYLDTTNMCDKDDERNWEHTPCEEVLTPGWCRFIS